jgi:hypothetical protein
MFAFWIVPSTLEGVLAQKKKMRLCVCVRSKVTTYVGLETIENQLLNQKPIRQPITNMDSETLLFGPKTMKIEFLENCSCG